MNTLQKTLTIKELPKAAVRLSPDLICLHDADGTYRYVSDSVTQLLGYSPAELSGTSPYTLFHPEDIQHVISTSHKKVRSGKRNQKVVYRIRRKDGSYTWFETITEPFKDDSGEVTALVSYSRDISDRKTNIRQYNEAEERFKAAFKYSSIGKALVALDGSFLQVNDALCRMVGYTEHELLETDFQNLTHPDDLHGDLENALKLLYGDIESYEMEKRYFHKNGCPIWVMLAASLVRDPAGRPLYYITQMQDISKKKEYEQELLQIYEQQRQVTEAYSEQNRKLNRYFYVGNHDLRAHANNIGGLISLLDNDSPAEQYREIFYMLKQVSERLNESMNSLMNTVSLRKCHEKRQQQVKLQQVMNRVCQVLQADILRTDTVVIQDFRDELLPDMPQVILDSIFLNLISNAIKYRHPEREPHICISASQKDGLLEIHVSDNGIGIDLEEYGDKVFGFRNTFHGNPDATGLGLYLTRQHVEVAGGSIEVESTPGLGSTFIIRFSGTY